LAIQGILRFVIDLSRRAWRLFWLVPCGSLADW
jgi:hypothetical protein